MRKRGVSGGEWERGTQFTCFTGTKVQMLTPDLRRCRLLSLLLRKDHAEGYTEYAKVYSVYLLYWYKSANTDARGYKEYAKVVSLLGLLVQKCKY
jgi:hypothetical protein